MQIFSRTIDDFKTDRKDISPPLQPYLRLVPILFYLSVIAALLLNALFITQYSTAQSYKNESERRVKEQTAERDRVKVQRQALEDQTKKATDLSAWVESSRPLEPLVVGITRSIAANASLVDLSLLRDKDNPTQIQLAIQFQSENSKQLDTTLQTITKSRFRTFSPQQSMDKGLVEYSATLLWQEGAQESTPTEQ